MNWQGNLFFQKLVKTYKHDYLKTIDNKIKRNIASNIIDQIQSVRGRFLKNCDEEWIEVDHESTLRKTRQALRERVIKKTREAPRQGKKEANSKQKKKRSIADRLKSNNGVEKISRLKSENDAAFGSNEKTPQCALANAIHNEYLGMEKSISVFLCSNITSFEF